MHIWHLTYASDGRNPLFPDEVACRKAVRVLGRVAGTSTVLFNIVDDHLHLVLWCDRQRRGRLARALVQALRQVATVPVESARVRAVENRAHMKWLVDYLLSQTIHRGIPAHTALWSGSCFPDLIGARWVPRMELQLRKALPPKRCACDWPWKMQFSRSNYDGAPTRGGTAQPVWQATTTIPGRARLPLLKKMKFRTPRRKRPPIPPAPRTELADNCLSDPWEKDENRTRETSCPVARQPNVPESGALGSWGLSRRGSAPAWA